MNLCEAIVAYDIENWYMLSLKWTFITTKGQGHLLTFVLEVSDFSIFIFSSKTAGLIETKSHVEPLWDGGMKVCSWDLGQMIKIFAMPLYGKKPFENFLLRTWKTEDLETWYAALGTLALPGLFK